MAIRLATLFADEAAADVSILTMTDKPAAICKRWDRTVTQTQHVSFSRWANDLSCVLWTTIPHVEQVRWVRRQKKRTVIVVRWHEIDNFEDMYTLASVDVLLCPHRTCYEFLRAAGLSNAIYCGWDCGQPFHTKPMPYEIINPSIFVPLWDGNARRSEMTVVRLLDSLTRRRKQLKITVACNSSTLATPASRQLSRNRQIAVQRSVPPATRFRLFQFHDLTLCPSHFESTCMTAIQSLELGTPVVAFGYRPMTEVLTNTNSVTIRCTEEFNDIGLPRAIPDYNAMEEELYYLLNDLEYLRQLQGTTLLGLSQRRETFTQAVKRVVV